MPATPETIAPPDQSRAFRRPNFQLATRTIYTRDRLRVSWILAVKGLPPPDYEFIPFFSGYSPLQRLAGVTANVPIRRWIRRTYGIDAVARDPARHEVFTAMDRLEHVLVRG